MNREDMIEAAIEVLMDKGFNERTARNRAQGMSNHQLERTVYGRD